MGGEETTKLESLGVTVSPHKSSRHMSTLFLIGLGAMGVVVLIVALSLGGIVYIGTKKPSQKTSVVTQVCGSNDVLEYNSALGFDSDQGAANAEQTLAALAKSIKAKNGNELDPTCQYILWQYAYSIGDKQSQQTYLAKLTALNSRGAYASGQIKSLDDLDTLQTLTNENKSVEVKGQG